MSKYTNAIENWDHESVEDLRDMLAELKEANECNQFMVDEIDMSNLPSEQTPDDVDTSYPIWAMDKRGFCLVGAAADSIEHISEIRELQ